jgi:hypothetical protein
MIIRYATREEFREFFGKLPPTTVKGFVAEVDGEVMAIGGYFYSGSDVIAFTDVNPKMRKRDIVVAGKIFSEKLRALVPEVLAEAKNPSALRHFGFEPYTGSLWKMEK